MGYKRLKRKCSGGRRKRAGGGCWRKNSRRLRQSLGGIQCLRCRFWMPSLAETLKMKLIIKNKWSRVTSRKSGNPAVSKLQSASKITQSVKTSKNNASLTKSNLVCSWSNSRASKTTSTWKSWKTSRTSTRKRNLNQRRKTKKTLIIWILIWFQLRWSTNLTNLMERKTNSSSVSDYKTKKPKKTELFSITKGN